MSGNDKGQPGKINAVKSLLLLFGSVLGISKTVQAGQTLTPLQSQSTQNPNLTPSFDEHLYYDSRNIGVSPPNEITTIQALLIKMDTDEKCWFAKAYDYEGTATIGRTVGEWYENPQNFDTLLQIAQNLLEKYPITNYRIFALGQTPSWIVKGAELISRTEDNTNFGYIAFSSHFVKPQSESLFAFVEDRMPTRDQITKYRTYLTSIGMDINQIIHLYNEEGIKTVITDGICTGQGYVSFISVLATWASEIGKLDELREALTISKLQWDCDDIGISKFIEPKTGTEFSFEEIPVPPEDRFFDLIDSLVDDIEHRLVAYYPPKYWDSKPVLNNDKNNKWITAELTQRAHNSHRPTV
jgi:hypothetical protein